MLNNLWYTIFTLRILEIFMLYTTDNTTPYRNLLETHNLKNTKNLEEFTRSLVKLTAIQTLHELVLEISDISEVSTREDILNLLKAHISKMDKD